MVEKIVQLANTVLEYFKSEGETAVPEVDMSIFSPATLIARAVEALTPDVPYLNEIERKTYATAVENYKLNKGRDPNLTIPNPPLAYELRVDYANFSVYVGRGTTPVCEKYVDPDSLPKPEKAGVILPPFAPGRYLAILGDNAPAGYRITLADGTVVEKVLTPWFAGVSVEYRKVQ